jgi:hypothetical protein
MAAPLAMTQEQQALRASLRDRAKPTTQIPLNQVAERVLGLLR